MFRTGAMLLVSLVLMTSAHASSVRFREECGLSFAVCGDLIALEQGGPAYEYLVDQSPDRPEPAAFSLAYVGNQVLMTALNDNGVATGPFLPFGLAVYPGSGPVITLASPESTAYGFFAFNAFPSIAGQSLSITISPVPEPAAYVLFVGGLAVMGWIGRRQRKA